MRAVVYDPDAPTNLSFGDVAEPVPASDEVVVDVKAIALNVGEIHWIENARQPGEVPGWDSAGVVVRAAADGSGPPVGSRVVAFHWAAGWAQRRAAASSNIAVLPDSVKFPDAAALPVAGMTALQAIRALRLVVGRRVLITGAPAGSVGLPSSWQRAQARTSSPPWEAPRAEPGCPSWAPLRWWSIWTGVSEPVFGVLDNVGGPLLAQAFRLASPAQALLSRQVPGKAILDVS